ncbi:MAG: TetR family transcriptional regulator [Alphaproteobacteria bacterium 13_2_20CM_2_64_7]|jgi:AcrR family transcriptional regulator|nr:MAG: TetR family transcriptional regulator [Alphaproteobacteria bacterium 13_2_20CM_2_64_7]
MPAKSAATYEKDERIPPRSRILAAAGELFYRHGIRAVGVDAIAEAAGTNKMTLYRHFASKDELVAEYLRQFAEFADTCWDRFARAHPGDSRAQLRAWLIEMAEHLASAGERGCALANAAVELPEKDHPARRVIEDFKRAHRARLVELCRNAGLSEPDMLADELHLLLEGARVTAQSVGADGLGARLVRMGEAMITAHAPRQ